MLTLPPGAGVLLATGRVDDRKGINGLSALVRSQFDQVPLSGQLFVFFSRRADRGRVLYWDRDGYVLTTKAPRAWAISRSLEERARPGHEAAELLLVLEGIDLTHAKRRKAGPHEGHR